uniref:Immunoglobulin like and fibronectin type III domain containing 1, tandem duplicate 3 n=1 Tax=Astyanax mexicanus TaxID=7994 RepID=A0A3B1J3U6_ASTMX
MKFPKSKDEEPRAPGQGRKKSSVPGVMITQYVEQVPAGKSHPDFTRKPIALTIQEGKFAFFKAIITGDPKPDVKWTRNNGDMSDTERYIVSYDPIQEEHQLQMPNVSVDQADTYKCFAENEFGRAVVTATLNVIEIGFKKSKALQEARTADRPKEERKEGEVDERFWELLLSADKKDYEKICAEYGVTDFRWMLKKLNEKKREIEEQQAQYVEYLGNLRHIEIKNTGSAQFEFEMDLKDPNAKIFLYKDGVMVPFSVDADEKHSLRQTGRRFVFSVNGLSADDAGLYQVDVEGVNVFSTDFKIPMVEFLVKLQEVKAVEREDAVFECVLSAPIPKITWMGKSTPLVQGEKYDITVSEDMLIHRLVVKDCMKVDNGIYAAVVGIKSCNAWLIVEADNDPNNRGKKAAQKFTINIPESKTCNFDSAPTFTVPLKTHASPEKYECYMSCAVRGNPTPRITWYRNNVSINANSNYFISNTCGVCSLLILSVGPKDNGEYKIVAENSLGRNESSTQLTIRGIITLLCPEILLSRLFLQ